MQIPTPEILFESVLLFLYVILAGVLTVGGLFLEYVSVQQFSSGDVMVAAWLAIFGALLLYAGVYAVGYGKVISRTQ